MSERLLIQVSGESGAPAELPRAGVLVIGASKSKAGLVVNGQGVAEVHCAIGKVKGGGWAIKDMGSDFGTLVNGKKVKSQRLAAGDQILVGSRRLAIVEPGDLGAEKAAAAAPAKKDTGPEELRPAEAARALRETRTKTPALTDTQRAPILGGYRIERTLGRGNMGKVFLAVQESLDRQVALKVLAPHLGKDKEFVRKFQDEARAAAQLNHPNVVVVHDVGEQNGFHYLSMEYMDRGSVEELLAERGRLGYREVLSIAKDAASGLVFAEQRGIVHQDIKPANLMRNNTGATKIADLGLAVQVSAQEELDTAGKKIFGTPHFISPEQLRGEAVDCRSDLYSLGATLYQLLTGETPFTGETTREILRGHLKETARPIRELAPDVPDEAVRMVERLLEKDPADRYPSASALLSEVERLIARESGAPINADGKSPSSVGKYAVIGGLALAAGLALVVLNPFGGGGEEPDPNNFGAHAGAGNGSSTGGGTPSENGGNTQDGDQDPNAGLEEQNPDNGSGVADVEPVRDDMEIKLFETEAENALLRLSQEQLTEDVRVERLRALASKYAGTDAANRAQEKAEEIVTALAAVDQAAAARQAELGNVFAELEKAARLDLSPPKPGEVLLAIAAVVPPTGLEQDPNFLEKRRSLQQAVVDQALEFAAEKNEAADAAAARGDRAAFENFLRAIVNSITVPTFEAENAPPGLVALREVRAVAKDRLERADLILAEQAELRMAEDALLLAEALGGQSGLEAELLALDFGKAHARLGSALDTIPAPEVRGALEGLHEDLGAAVKALGAISGSFGDWRRKTLADPRSGKTTTAIGVDSKGLRSEDGEWPWSAYGGKTKELSRLFKDRLDRDYDAAETRGVASILKITAVLEAVDVASQMFSSTSTSRFSESEAESLVEVFDYVEPWITEPGERARYRREIEAASILAETLLAAEAERWSTAVAGSTRLLKEYGDTLLVLLYSDGTRL